MTYENIDREELLESLKADYESARELRSKLDSKIDKWKREYSGEPYGNERKNRSQLVSRDIKKQSEWQHASLIEPFVSTPDIIKANPVTAEDTLIAPKIEVLLNTQFCRQFNRFNFMTKALKVLDIEGTVVVRTGWEYEEKEILVREMVEQDNPEYLKLLQLFQIAQQNAQQGDQEAVQYLEQLQQALQQIPPTIEVPKVTKQVKPVKNHPTASVVRNEDVFIDPTCGDDFDKAQFVVYRYETDLTTLKSSDIYNNLEQLEISLSKDTEYRELEKENESSFEFKDKARKKILVYEYWGNYDINNDGITEPIICTWVNNTIIRLEENPFPDKKPPFIVTPFSYVPDSLYGESNAELISDIQKIKTAIYRGFIDNMAMSNNGQKGIMRGSLDRVNERRFLEGDNFVFDGNPNSFYEGNFNELPSSIFNILNLMNNEAESITGIASFNTGINGNALGNSATSIRGAIDSASTRRLNIVRNISENLIKPLLRKWLAYNSEFLDEESQFRITNDEFIWLKRDDLGANIDIELGISTSDDNQSKAQELAFLLQTIGPHEDPNIRRILMTEIARLYRMPELAKRLEEYEPQPDPMTEKMRELEIQMFEAQIRNEQAKGAENETDIDLKTAKAETERAKAKNLLSQADKTDLDYIQQYSGVKHRQEMEKAQSNNQFKLNAEALKFLGNIQKKQNL